MVAIIASRYPEQGITNSVYNTSAPPPPPQKYASSRTLDIEMYIATSFTEIFSNIALEKYIGLLHI